jgi:hypothetical protein
MKILIIYDTNNNKVLWKLEKIFKYIFWFLLSFIIITLCVDKLLLDNNLYYLHEISVYLVKSVKLLLAFLLNAIAIYINIKTFSLKSWKTILSVFSLLFTLVYIGINVGNFLSLLWFQEIIIWLKLELISIFCVFFQIIVPREIYLLSHINFIDDNRIKGFYSVSKSIRNSNYMTQNNERDVGIEENNSNGNNHNTENERINSNGNNHNTDNERRDTSNQVLNESNDLTRRWVRKPILMAKWYRVSREEKLTEINELGWHGKGVIVEGWDNVKDKNWDANSNDKKNNYIDNEENIKDRIEFNKNRIINYVKEHSYNIQNKVYPTWEEKDNDIISEEENSKKNNNN